MLAASAAFRAAPNPTAAADVVGAMLNRWHYIALAAPLALFALELRRVRRLALTAIFLALTLAAVQVFVDLQIRAMRVSSPVAISSLDREHPDRKRFGALHGASMALLLLQTIAAAMVVADREKKEELAMPNTDADDRTIYKVVVNEEERYSIWRRPRERPRLAGHRHAGPEGAMRGVDPGEGDRYASEARGHDGRRPVAFRTPKRSGGTVKGCHPERESRDLGGRVARCTSHKPRATRPPRSLDSRSG